ncbi:MAG: hypothetical protein Q9224_003176 [Gallowayella concinna]
MSSSEKVIVAFDLYGTLLSTESIAKELAKHYGEEKAATVAAAWRKHQLEYTWRLNSMVVFSNGTQQMVGNSVRKSPDLSPYSEVFQNIVTVEEVGKFKPHPDVYHHLAKKVGKGKEQMNDIWLVSGNPFDVVGAKAVGMKACWVNRASGEWNDALIDGEAGKPDLVIKDLGEVVERVLETSKPNEQ